MATTSEDQERDAPNDINFDCIVVDVCFHPEKNIIATGDIDGDVRLYSYSTTDENHEVMMLPHHKKSCRCLRFSPDGNRLFTGSKDKSLCVVDMESGAVSQHILKAHSSPMYCMYVVDENIIASGDDDGNIKVWDLRQGKSIMDVRENEEFISDLTVGQNRKLLLATSGEGTLSCFDIRKHKLKMQSELFDSEMLSLAIMKNGEKVVCGNGEGSLNIFNWGEWGNISDRFPGHPMSIDCMIPYNDSILFTGSFDGAIRAVNIFPNRFMGVVGEHKGFPVENITLSHCNRYLASCSHDQKVCFWNVEDIEKETIDTNKRARKTNKPKVLNKAMARNEFFADLGETEEKASAGTDDSDDDSDDGSDDGDSDDVQEGPEKDSDADSDDDASDDDDPDDQNKNEPANVDTSSNDSGSDDE